MNLLSNSGLISHSGNPLSWKIECGALGLCDWECAARLLAPLVGPFGRSRGIPDGGLALADAMEEYATPGAPAVVICDDVLTTGASMWAAFGEESRHNPSGTQQSHPIRGAVLFNRSGVPAPAWIVPLFNLSAGVAS